MRRIFFIIPFFLFLFLNLPAQAEIIDSDNDGLSDQDEATTHRTDPKLADTDGDGFNDGQEIKKGFSPLAAGKRLNEVDTDKDGLTDQIEINLGTDLGDPDSDGDGYKDGLEVEKGFSPFTSLAVKLTKKIGVDLQKQKLVYYLGEKKMDEFLISSGLPGTPTPKGEFEVLEKKPAVNYKGPGYNFPNTKWNLKFKKSATMNYFIHGAYWHNKFGKPMSHGCVNVAYKNMEYLYKWAEVGTKIMIK